MRDIAKRGGAPGQVTACIFGLKNAVPEEWREVQHQQLEHTGNLTETPTLRLELSPRALAHVEELKRLLLRDDDEPLEPGPAGPRPTAPRTASAMGRCSTENGEAVIYDGGPVAALSFTGPSTTTATS